MSLLLRRALALRAIPRLASSAVIVSVTAPPLPCVRPRPSLQQHQHFGSGTSTEEQPAAAAAAASQPRPQSRYLGVHFNPRGGAEGKGCWVATLQSRRKSVLWRSFPLHQEKEAALAVDEAIQQHLGPEYLTNYDTESGAFLDPKRALEPSAAGTVGTAGNAARAGLVVSFVPELDRYKAAARCKGRPVLVGLFASAEEAQRALVEWAARQGGPIGSGGMAEAPKQSRFLGVSWYAKRRMWRVRLIHDGKNVLSQLFSEGLEEEAARVYDAHARKHLGPDALTNFDLDGAFLDPKGSASRQIGPGGVDYRGVSFSQEKQKWYAKISVKGKTYPLGFFTEAKDAALCYDAAARKHHGSRARCNFDEHGQRTAVRIKLNNSSEARKRYVLKKEQEQREH